MLPTIAGCTHSIRSTECAHSMCVCVCLFQSDLGLVENFPVCVPLQWTVQYFSYFSAWTSSQFTVWHGLSSKKYKTNISWLKITLDGKHGVHFIFIYRCCIQHRKKWMFDCRVANYIDFNRCIFTLSHELSLQNCRWRAEISFCYWI